MTDPCPQLHTIKGGLDSMEYSSRHEGVNSWAACSRLCRQHTTCDEWMWISREIYEEEGYLTSEEKEDVNRCYLKSW